MAARRTDWNVFLGVVLIGVVVSVCTARDADITVVLQIGESETITSPNYPNDYDNSADILWSIEAPAGYNLGLVFTAFYLEKCCDYLTISNQIEDTGFDVNDRENVTKLTGSNLPHPVISYGRRTWIRFRSDVSVTHSGFSFALLIVPYDNTITLQTGENETITLPDYPNYYDNHADILWIIEAPAGYKLGLVFTAFNLDNRYDYLTIYNQKNDNTENKTALTGSDLPNPVVSDGRQMLIRFRSDDSSTDSGFSLDAFVLSRNGGTYQTKFWHCDFELDECNVMHRDGSWSMEEHDKFDSKYYEADLNGRGSSDVASFTLPILDPSRTGFVYFQYYSWTEIRNSADAEGSLSVDICGNNVFHVFSIAKVVYDVGPLNFTCFTNDDIEITFTATIGSRATYIAVDDILVIGIPDPPENVTSTLSSELTTAERQTSRAMTTIMNSLHSNTPPAQSVSEGHGSSVVPVLASLLGVMVFGFLVLAVLLVRKRRYIPPPEPSKTEEDDPKRFQNPAFRSEDIPQTPGTVMGVHAPPRTTSAGNAERPSDTGGQTRVDQDDFSTYQSLDEPEHRIYQGLTEMGKKGNTATPAGTQAPWINKYNGHNGKTETGDNPRYHVTQATKDLPPTDEAVYEEYQFETGVPEEEFSTIKQDTKTRSNRMKPALKHEPLYTNWIHGK